MLESVWIFLVLGFLLLFAEIVFVPGLGITGVLGLILFLTGVFMVGAVQGPAIAFGVFMGGLLLLGLSFVAFLNTPASKLFILKSRGEKNALKDLDIPEGARGFSSTPLYPSGKAIFVVDSRERTLDVSTDGEFVDSGKEIEVVRQEGGRVYVREFS